FKESLEVLKKDGAEIVDIELPSAPLALAVYYIIMPAESSTNLARFDGVRYGLSLQGDSLTDDYAKTRAAGFGPEVRRRIMLGTYVLSAGYYDAYYGKATAARAVLRREYDDVLKNVDVIATPTVPSPAFKVGEKSDPLSMYLADIFTVTANLTGHPSLSIPIEGVRRNEKDLPVGIQFTAAEGGEEMLFAAGKMVK
ncbi:MAG TPA: amidase family protein, partial [Candidatus Paceibacterota bacterium]